MPRRFTPAIALLSAALACAACTPADSAPPPPPPSPTYSCTTSTVNDPCTAAKAQKEQEQAAGITSSVAAYKAFLAERNKIARHGGAESATPVMMKYAGGPYLDTIEGFLKEEREKRQRYTSDLMIRHISYLPGATRSSSPPGEMTFRFCEDGRANKVLDPHGKKVGVGALISGVLYTRNVDGWKLWDADAKVVTKCEEGY